MSNNSTRQPQKSLIILLIIACTAQLNIEGTKTRIKSYLSDPRRDMSKLRAVLESGSMDGHFKSQEIYDLFFDLEKAYPQFVSSEVIGQTFLKKDIYAFKLVKQSKDIFIESLHSLVHKTPNSSFWMFNDLLIVPIVNLDGHLFISDSFNTPEWDNRQLKRKNMNTKYCPQSETRSGVDLNRNYGYHYGETTDDLDLCSETYRGPTSFSEPETQAMRSFIEKEKTIASAMNFHAYGNIWIHPFNYMHTPHKYPISAYREIINFYEQFKSEVKVVSDAAYGNAIETVDYATDGEGSDWMLGEYKIVAFSPELGLSKGIADSFIVDKDLICRVIDENYKVVELFMRRNNFEVDGLLYSVNNNSQFVISFTNKGLANIFSPVFKLTAANSDFLESVTEVKIRNEEDNHVDISTIDRSNIKDKGLAFAVPQVNRLKEFTLYLTVSDPNLLRKSIDMNLEISMADGSSIASIDVSFELDKFGNLFTMTLLGLILLFGIMVIVFGLKIRRLSREKMVGKAAVDTEPKVTKALEAEAA